jgi:hypothetical protein
MIGENALPFRRCDEQGELVGALGRTSHDGQAIICTDRQGVRQGNDLLVRIFPLRVAGGRAIGEKDVNAAFGNVPAVGIAAGRRRGAGGATGELKRLASRTGRALVRTASALRKTSKA